MKTYEYDENLNYDDLTYSDISDRNKGYGPCSWDNPKCICSHELIHYFQFIKHGKSSCESDLILNIGKYNKELASEHKNFTEEIYKLIESSEYSNLKKRWKEI